MIARVRRYRTSEEAVMEWDRFGLTMPSSALSMVPEVSALFVEGPSGELEPLWREARSLSLTASLSEAGRRPRLCLVAEKDELAALDAVAGTDMFTEAAERYASDGAPDMTIPEGRLSFQRPLVMGILNVTPDSFSDGDPSMGTDAWVLRALTMVEEGADIIDIGGESTRPGAEPVPLEEELRRTVPVIRLVAAQTDVPISIDTRKPQVAEAAIEAGARIINDVSGLEHPGMSRVAAERGAPVVLMHSLADPRVMQQHVAPTTYEDIIADIMWNWEERMVSAGGMGLGRDRIILDPGIGFGKLPEHNLHILDRMRELRCAGRPLLAGASRKAFIGRITGEPPGQRLGGSLAAAAVAVLNGASIVRVHDVRETVSLVRTLGAVRPRT